MKRKRKALLLAPTLIAILFILVGIVLLGQPPPEAQPTSPVEDVPTDTDAPPNLLVIPEVPLGTLAIILACFSALIISQMRPRKLQ